MTDREKLLIDLVRESERRAGAKISVLDVIAMLDTLGAEHQLAVRRKLVRPVRACSTNSSATVRSVRFSGWERSRRIANASSGEPTLAPRLRRRSGVRR